MEPEECTQSILDHIVTDKQWVSTLSDYELEIHRLKQKVAALEMKCESAQNDHLTVTSTIETLKGRIEASNIEIQEFQKRISKLVIERDEHREHAVEAEEQYQAVLGEMESLKEEREDLMDRISALSLGLKRRTNESESVERELRRNADRRLDAEMRNVS